MSADEKRAFIKEIVLENFMSYEYARIPLTPGLNLISGPNGAGKSSILLAISVALGQAYTERSKRLSDLIRHGKDTARVSLLFDNRPINGKRPIEMSNSDTFLLSRYLRRDGSYWYEADYKEVSKYQVQRIFGGLGLNPDNMLIIMHQNMVEMFALTSPQEKLALLEEAVGLKDYRRKIIEAENRLSAVLSEEASVSQILSSAEQTLNYWKEVYDKYIQKKKLSERLALLEREVFWAQVARHEKTLQSLLEKLKAREAELERLNRGLGETKRKITETEASHKDMKLEYRKTFFSLLEKEKELAGIIAANNLFNKIKEKVGVPADLEEELEASAERIPSIKREISAVQARVIELEEKLDKKLEEYIALKSDKAIMEFRKRGLQGEIKNFQDWVREAESKLATLKSGVEDIGERVETQRTIKEIEEEIGVVKARIEALGDIPEEAEKIYDDYSAFYEELKRRMEEVKKNRERAMSEVEARKDIWKRELRKLIKEVNATFKSILSKINATGRLKLINIEDLEEAGLEIWVGFRGSEMSLLDARTQSGGERTTAVVSFLLALQRHIKSPFLAMDEYDMHMDSRNREIIFHMITSAVRESGIQYIVITPRQIAPPGDETNFIVVQNVYGVSEARRVG